VNGFKIKDLGNFSTIWYKNEFLNVGVTTGY